jgi:hypothetical protein
MSDTTAPAYGYAPGRQPTKAEVEMMQSFADLLTPIVEEDIPAATDPLYE